MDYSYNYSDYTDYEYTWNYEDQDEIPSAFDLSPTVCHFLIFCISMPGNSFLLWVLLRERSWKTTSDILLLQLTVSALCATVTQPFWAYNPFHGWISGDWACVITRGVYFLGQNSFVVVLTAMVLCLSAPTFKKFLLVASIGIWLICAAASIKLSMNFVAHDSGCFNDSRSITVLLIDIYMQIGLFFLIPFIIITFCYVHMWITTKQASRLILGIAVGLFLCLAPHSIVLFILSLTISGVLDYTAVWLPYYVSGIIVILPYFHCSLNLFHIFGAQRFRRYLCMPCDTSPQR